MTPEIKIFNFKVEVMLRIEVLDPQGEVIKKTFENNGIKDIFSVRQGKIFELQINCSDKKAARKSVERMCKDILVNPVIEEYKIFEV